MERKELAHRGRGLPWKVEPGRKAREAKGLLREDRSLGRPLSNPSPGNWIFKLL